MSAIVSSIFEPSPASDPTASLAAPDETAAPRWDTLSDEDLLRRNTDANDQTAFQALYVRYRIRLHRFILRLSRDSHEAEEIFQETWMAVIRGKVKYHPSARFAAYLFSIAHRRLADRWRRVKRSSALQSDGETSCDPDDIADDFTVTPEEWTQHAQLRNALLAELGKLPVTQREVFLMKAEADLSVGSPGRTASPSRCRRDIGSRARIGPGAITQRPTFATACRAEEQRHRAQQSRIERLPCRRGVPNRFGSPNSRGCERHGRTARHD